MKRIVLGTAVLGLAVAGLAPASAAPSVYKVTGGGQITEAGSTGAGNTLAFTAQSAETSGDLAKGQVQYVDRTAGNGQAQVRSHGTVTCVFVQQASDGAPARARIEGTLARTDQPGETTFTVDVVDNGQGSAADMDMVAFRYGGNADSDDDGDTTCDLDDDVNAGGGLGRGNVKIHEGQDAGTTQGGGKGGKGGSAL